MANNTTPPFQFSVQYVDPKQPSGFSFIGQQQFAAMQAQLASHANLIATLQAQIKALQNQ